MISAAYQELALLSISSNPSLWEVLVKNKWRKLDVELATWLEDQWRGDVQQASLHEQIEVGSRAGIMIFQSFTFSDS